MSKTITINGQRQSIDDIFFISGYDIYPKADNIWSLGSAAYSIKDLHVQNIVYATSVAGNWNPSEDNQYDLGEVSTPLEWKDLYLDGVAYIDEIQQGDNEKHYFGAGLDYWLIYNSSGTQWELWGTDVDGAGADGLIMSVDDGTDDVDFTGAITLGGHIAIADAAFSDTIGIFFDETFTDPAANCFGAHFITRAEAIAANNANQVEGVIGEFRLTASNTKNWTVPLVGVLGTFYILAGATGTISEVVSLWGEGTVSACTITDYYGLKLVEPIGAGAITNSYGIYINGVTKGVILNYAIYTNGGLVHFGDSFDIADDKLLGIGANRDGVLVNRSSVLNEDTTLAGVLIGTPDTPALAANSLIIANATEDGDILLSINDGGTSKQVLFADGSTNTVDLGKPFSVRINDGEVQFGTGSAWNVRLKYGENDHLYFYNTANSYYANFIANTGKLADSLIFLSSSGTGIKGAVSDNNYYDLFAYNVNGSAYASAVRIQNANDAAAPIEIGFFGATPVYKQIDADFANTPNSGDIDTDDLIDKMRDALIAFGLVASA